MAKYQHSGHAKHDIKYHIVWITKYRYKIITPEIGKRLKELLIQGCRSRGISIRKGHIDVDHVHLLLSCPPDLSVSKIVQYLKGRSSHLLQDEYSQLKKRYWGQHLWGRGYFCVTVGAMTEDMIKAYIESHEEEDKEITVHDEFQS
jgi:putative transposase